MDLNKPGATFTLDGVKVSVSDDPGSSITAVLLASLDAALALVLTDWFDTSKFNPGSVGVYQVNTSPLCALRYSYWNGENWCMGAGSVHTAYRNRHYPQKPWSAYAVKAFRGLKNKPA